MDKKMEIKRLCIYLLLSFGLSWIPFITYALSGHKLYGENPYLESFLGLGMLFPVIAHVLTRLITKEGFALTGKDSMMLGIDFKNRKWIYYLFAIFIPWLYLELGYAITLLVVPKAFDPDYYKIMGISRKLVFASPFINMISGIIYSFAAFGEEGGWRGYMMPKLTNIFGIKKAVLIGGIIWGVWHAPLTCIGHNFGTDYPGFPYVGILIMCIDCTFMGIMLTYITEKTRSVWPAAIMHAINNQSPSILRYFADYDKVQELMPFPMFNYVGLLIPNILIGSICLVLLLREEVRYERMFIEHR